MYVWNETSWFHLDPDVGVLHEVKQEAVLDDIEDEAELDLHKFRKFVLKLFDKTVPKLFDGITNDILVRTIPGYAPALRYLRGGGEGRRV